MIPASTTPRPAGLAGTAIARAMINSSVMAPKMSGPAPFRLGEGAKIYIGHTVFDYPIGALGVSVVIEKLYDLAAIIILALIVVLGAGTGVIDLRMLAPLCLIGALVAVGLYLIRMNAEKIARHLED